MGVSTFARLEPQSLGRILSLEMRAAQSFNFPGLKLFGAHFSFEVI